MAIAARAADSVIAKESERPDLDRLARVIRDAEGRVTLVSPSGESAEMPESVADVLRQVLPHFLRGDAVTLVAVRKHLTTQQAANILNVSRPYLVRLLDEEKIPHTRAGTHRRIALTDLLAYRQERDRQRRQSLSRLTQLSQELGLYSSERRAGD